MANETIANAIEVGTTLGEIVYTKDISMAGANAIGLTVGAAVDPEDALGGDATIDVWLQVTNDLENWMYQDSSGDLTTALPTVGSSVLTWASGSAMNQSKNIGRGAGSSYANPVAMAFARLAFRVTVSGGTNQRSLAFRVDVNTTET